MCCDPDIRFQELINEYKARIQKAKKENDSFELSAIRAEIQQDISWFEDKVSELEDLINEIDEYLCGGEG